MKKFLRFISLCLILFTGFTIGSMLINNSEVQAGQDQVGVVKWFDTKSGVGVIISRNTGAEVFVHFSSIKGKTKSLTPGQIVTFTAVGTDKGLRTLIVNTK